MEEIIILGAGGLAREVVFVIEEINRISPKWKILGYADLQEEKVGKKVGKHSIICTEEDLLQKEVSVAVGIGNPKILQELYEKLKKYPNLSFPNLLHPNIVLDSETVIMGEGNIVCAGSVFTVNVKVGSFNYFNLACTYGHDTEIGNACVVNPGVNVSGGAKIGDACLIGTGAKILQYINIGSESRIGAGAVVIKDVPPSMTVVGVPAEPLKKR